MEPLPSTKMETDLSIVTSPIHQLHVHKPFKDITVYSTTTQERRVHSRIATCIYTRQKSNSIQQKKIVSQGLIKQWLAHIRSIQTPALLAKVNRRRENQEKAPQPHRCLSTIQISLHISSPLKICHYLCHIKKYGSRY